MMKKKGVALVIALIFLLVFSILLVSFFVGSISESQQARFYADSTTAFWLAEAGIARVKSTLGINAVSETNFQNDSRYSFTATPQRIGTTNYYKVTSTGRVSYANRSISRTIIATMKLEPASATKFQYSLETSSNKVDYKSKNIRNSEDPTKLVKTNSTQTFSDLFGLSKDEMKALAQEQGIYLSGDFGNSINASGITWVDVTAGTTLSIQHLNGSGLVIINGNFRVNGVPFDGFDGILYVIGQLEALGNATINGSVFVESSASVGADLTGSALVNYSSANIANALLPFATKSIVSWQEQES